MKFNWATGIVTGMALFIGFILFLVYQMTTKKGFDHDLVTEEYYAKEIEYQREIDAEKNTQNLMQAIESKKVENGWELTFPPELQPSKIKGKLFLYRPSNEKLDKELPIHLSNARLLIPDKYLLAGRWNITMEWEYEGEWYMYKEEITY